MTGPGPVAYCEGDDLRRTQNESVSLGRRGAKFVMLVPRLLADADNPDTAMLGFVFPIERDDDAG